MIDSWTRDGPADDFGGLFFKLEMDRLTNVFVVVPLIGRGPPITAQKTTIKVATVASQHGSRQGRRHRTGQ